MWEFIDKFIYINLDHRQDRRDIMKKFFEEGQVPEEKIHRFSAISHPVGAVGASYSHIGVLELAKENNWKSILILEDDVCWTNFQENYPKLEKLLDDRKEWDVCMLGGIYIEINNPDIKASYSGFSYIVREHYYDRLLENMKEGLKIKLSKKIPVRFYPNEKARINKYYDMVKNDYHHSFDAYWILIQAVDNWIGMFPRMTDHLHTFSDVRKTNDYTDNMEVYKLENKNYVNKFKQIIKQRYNLE